MGRDRENDFQRRCNYMVSVLNPQATGTLLMNRIIFDTKSTSAGSRREGIAGGSTWIINRLPEHTFNQSIRVTPCIHMSQCVWHLCVIQYKHSSLWACCILRANVGQSTYWHLISMSECVFIGAVNKALPCL